MLRSLECVVLTGFVAALGCAPVTGPEPGAPAAAVEPAPVERVAEAPGPAARPGAYEDPKLLPRAVIFGNPDREAPALSPDGAQLLYLAPVQGVMNVWVGPVGRLDDAKPVTQDALRGIRTAMWSAGGD